MKIKKNDLFIGIYLLAAVLFFIISIPSWLLDILLAINILVAMVVLFNSLFAKEVLDMASFPTMLLFTTIFRISLNVSSTKLILKNGDAGKVVDTFGKFVGGGNLVIGIIIFIILIIVQFIVINKGSERVAEVTARFTLDAMAGKQMAIDSDLNTGAITDKEAAERRKKLQQENSFFGSMDGATKYVKGDATAGLIITGINLVGGIVMGMVYGGLSINDALSKYTILTIGDGLSSQIPSLLISLATGILVTKASSDGELGDEIVGQLFSMDRVLIMVGAALSVLGILTPLPWYIFVPLGAALIFYGRKLGTKAGEAKIEESAEQEENEAQEIRKPENVVSLLNVDPIELEFGYGIIPLADVNQGGDLLDRVVMIRRQIALELGAVVPIIRLRDNIQLNPNQYVIKIKGIQVSEGEILFDHYMAMNPGYVEEEITGIPTFEPSFHLPAIWITESQRERAESLGYTVVDPPSIIATHLTEVIRQHIAELLTRQDVQNLINNIKDNNSTLKLHKSEDPNDTLAFSFKSVEIIPTYTEVTKKDSVVMFDGVRYRAYVYINPSQMKVVKTTYSEDGISMDNIYYDNVMHICVYEGKKSLYAKDITKQMFVDVIPTDFLQQAILSDMNFTGIDRKGYHYQALVCIPESPVCNLVNLTISFDGKLNITAAKYK